MDTYQTFLQALKWWVTNLTVLAMSVVMMGRAYDKAALAEENISTTGTILAYVFRGLMKGNQFALKWRHMATQIWVNIGSGNGLMPDGTKPLPKLMLTSH